MLCGPACEIMQFGSPEWVASVKKAVLNVHLSWEQHCGRLNGFVSFTTDEQQMTPNPQYY